MAEPLYDRDLVTRIARTMSERGCPVDKSVLEKTLVDIARDSENEMDRVFQKYRTSYLDPLEERYGRWNYYPQWKFNLERAFWASTRPNIQGIPYKAIVGLMGARVSMVQPYPYLAAKLAGKAGSQWTNVYENGTDLHAWIAERLGVERKVARIAFFDFISKRDVSNHKTDLVRAFPWLESIPQEKLFTRLTLESANIVRATVCQLFVETEQVPTLILTDFAVGSGSYVKKLRGLWENLGFQVETDLLAGDA